MPSETVTEGKPKTRKQSKRLSGVQNATRRQKLLSGVADGKAISTAAVEAGYSEGYAHTHIYEKPWLKAEICAMLDQAKLTNPHLATKLAELVEGKDTKFFPYTTKAVEEVPAGDGSTIKLVVTNQQIDTRDVISWDARARGLDMAFKLKRLYPTAEEAKSQAPVTNIVFLGIDPSKLGPPEPITVNVLPEGGNGKSNGRAAHA
jgi:hypothetical protein